MATIASLQRITAQDLSEMMLAEAEASSTSYAIVDVRDDDHIGGHIKGSMNVPSRTLDAMLPTLLRRFEDKSIVIFHCALSQQRGPTAALRYLREVERAKKRANTSTAPSSASSSDANGGPQDTTDGSADGDGNASTTAAKPLRGEQKVYVLDRGFVGWQEVYGEDERLTEGYRKEIWKDGYWG